MRRICAIRRGSARFIQPIWKNEELKNFFPEFHPYEGKCRFLGCIHGKEPGCAVKEALEQGNISKERFENYTMFYEELKEQEKRRY